MDGQNAVVVNRSQGDGAVREVLAQNVDVLLAAAPHAVRAAKEATAELAQQHRLPTASLFTVFPEVGGLLGYGPNVPDIMRRAAGYVARILRGAQAADRPVERPVKFELIVNVDAAIRIRSRPSVCSTGAFWR